MSILVKFNPMLFHAHPLLIAENILSKSFENSPHLIGLADFYPCYDQTSVNVTGETLVLGKVFPTIKQGFP